MIKVILQTDLTGQGKKGDVINVSPGFARNFLLPQNKAIIATENEVNKVEEEKSKSRAKEEEIRAKNLELKEEIESLEIEVKKKAKKGKLFGSLTPKEISEELKKNGLEADPKKIKIKSPIKSLGKHKVGIILDKNMEAALRVTIIEE